MDGDESNPSTFRQYVASMTANMVTYARDQLFHTLCRNNDPTTVHFLYFPHNNLEATYVINGLLCIVVE